MSVGKGGAASVSLECQYQQPVVVAAAFPAEGYGAQLAVSFKDSMTFTVQLLQPPESEQEVSQCCQLLKDVSS